MLFELMHSDIKHVVSSTAFRKIKTVTQINENE